MKILIVTDEGELLGQIEHLEEYDFDMGLARASVMNDIQEILEEQG